MLLIRLAMAISFPIAALSNAVCAQNYPNKPIRILTGAPGGSADFVSRQIGQGLVESWGQPVIVDNRAGTSAVPAEIVSKAPPEGYSLLLDGGSFWVTPLIQKMPYDPVKDFSPITTAISAPSVLVVHVSSPVTSLQELVALAKAKPGQLNFSSSGIGGSPHLAAELFKSMAGVNVVHVPYSGGGPGLNALVGGQEVQFMFSPAASATPHVKGGRLRALAVTSAKPSPLTPGLPTVAAAGLPGYEAIQILGVFAPANASPTLINRLNQEIVRTLNKPDVKQRLLAAGMEATGNSPEGFAALIKSEMAKWGKLIRDAGIKE